MARWPELINQLGCRFRDTSRISQILWITTAALLVAGLAWSWQSGRRVQHVELFGGRTFTSRELTTIEAAFAKAALNGYELDDGRVRVPQQARSAYIAALVDNEALPVDLSLSDQQSKTNPFETASQREARVARNRERELSAIIRSLNGIDDAAVHLDEEMQPGLHRRREVTAIVAVRPTAGYTLDAERVHHIQNIVAGSKIGLNIENVTVADLDAGTSYPLESNQSLTRLADSRRRYEQYLSAQVTNVLGFIPNVHVATTAEVTCSHHSDGPHEAGLPAAASSIESLTPQGVSISVAIPATYFRSAWRHGSSLGGKSSTPTPAELAETEAATQQRIMEAVRGTLPARLVDKPGATKITVTSFEPAGPDARLVMSPPENSSLPPQAWISALVGLVAIVALIASLVWSTTGTPPKASTREAPLLDTPVRIPREEASTPLDAVVSANHAELSPEPAPDDGIRQSLAAAVQDDPQAAAEVLRRWIGTAA